MRKHLFLLLALTLLHPCFAQCPMREMLTDMLDFSRGMWRAGLGSIGVTGIDSTMKYRNKYPAVYSQLYYRGINLMLPLQGTIYEMFPLPATAADSIEVSLTCKSRNVEKIFLAIDGIGENEEELYSDTLFAQCRDEWGTYGKKMYSRGASLLVLTIGFVGKNEAYATKREEPYKSMQNLWLDRIEIKRNGRNILDDSFYDSFAQPPLQIEKTVVWDDTLPQELEEKAIVAFGESVHGSETVNRAVIRLFRREIECGKRKLLLLEIPLSQALYINRFVQGDRSFGMEHIKSSMPSFLSDSWMEFFQWLRMYNSTAREKVWMLGMDYAGDYFDSQLDLCEYVLTVNRSLRNRNLKEFARLLFDRKPESIRKATDFFLEHDCFEEELGKQESRIVRLCLQTMSDASRQKKAGMWVPRDSLMCVHVKGLTEILSSDSSIVGTLIYAHLSHVKYGFFNVQQPVKTPPLGALCKQAYGDRFGTVGIFVGRGKVLSQTLPQRRYEETLVEEPVRCSFEYWLDRCPLPCFYVPRSALPVDMLFSRLIGATPFKMIDWQNPSCRMEGALYIKESAPLHKALKKDSPFILRYKKILDEVKGEAY